MPVINNVITDEGIEGRMLDLLDRFYRESGTAVSDGDIIIEGYMQGSEGYFYLAKYNGRPIASILHYKSQLVTGYIGYDPEDD